MSWFQIFAPKVEVKSIELMQYDIDVLLYSISMTIGDKSMNYLLYQGFMRMQNQLIDIKLNDFGSYYFRFNPEEIKMLNFLVSRYIDNMGKDLEKQEWEKVAKLLICINE